jgi:metal-responsive CopG/Arc/MetJ family transcriptional regulator
LELFRLTHKSWACYIPIMKFTRRLNVMLPPDVADELDAYAEEMRTTKSEVVRQLIVREFKLERPHSDRESK